MSEDAEPGPNVVPPIEHWVLHVDLDQFLAAVEVLRHPELAGRPVVVGGDGDPTKRGVVSTASYEAREHGVGSGMPLRLAARKCPDAVFLPVDHAAYDEASGGVMATLRALEWGGRPVVVEVLGWDEAFLAAGPHPDATPDPTRSAAYVGRGRPWGGAGEEVATEAEGTPDPADGAAETTQARAAAPTAATTAATTDTTPVVEAGQGSLPPVQNRAEPAGEGAPGGPSLAHPTPPDDAPAPSGRGLAPTGLRRPTATTETATGKATAATEEPASAESAPAIPKTATTDSGRPDTDPTTFAAQIRRAVLEATGLHCSVGIGDNKLRAKIATEFGKPRGSFVLTADNWFEIMGHRETKALWGIGAKTSKKLRELGIDTVDQLARADATRLAAELGPTMGPWFRRLGRGVSDSVVSGEPYVPRAHGRETTFQTDLTDWDEIEAEVRKLTQRVKEDLDRKAQRVGLKLRYKPFFTVTRSLTLPEPTDDTATLEQAAVSLLARVEHDRPVRLLGVRLEMVPPEGGY